MCSDEVNTLQMNRNQFNLINDVLRETNVFFNSLLVFTRVWRLEKFGRRGFFGRSRLPNFADRDSEKERVNDFFSEPSRSANFC